MSIGKNSIARAVNATASAKQTQTENQQLTVFQTDKIGCLAAAKQPSDISSTVKSIEKYGILCPVITAVTPKGDIWLVDGYKRLFAARQMGITQLNGVVINVENKSEANRIYNELNKFKSNKTDDIKEEKFKILAVKDHDLPPHLL